MARVFNSFQSFGKELDELAKEFEGAKKRKLLEPLAKEAHAIAYKYAARDTGSDRKFRGWAPVLDLRMEPTRGNGWAVIPTRASAGPWTVSTDGRNQGNAVGFAGPGINTRTGLTSRNKDGSLRKVRARKSRRWNGRTAGKGTSDDAVAEMMKKLPREIEGDIRKVHLKHFDLG